MKKMRRFLALSSCIIFIFYTSSPTVPCANTNSQESVVADPKSGDPYLRAL